MLKTHRTSKERTGYILKLRQSRAFKGIALTLALNIIVEMAHPTISLALTEGPSQPEVQSFEPIGTTQMVDLFTGDFNYNIPLFNLPGPNGGYPVNLAYHAGVSMDDEASWVGLGWNINPGALVRNMRGLPDEFLSEADANGNWTGGDFIETKTDMKESWSVGVNFSPKVEFVGGDLIKGNEGLNFALNFNNYKGLGFTVGDSKNPINSSPFGLGLSIDSENGLGVSPSLSLSKTNKETKKNFNLSLTFDGELSLGYSISRENPRKRKEKNEQQRSKSNAIGGNLSYARNSFTPSIGNKINSYRLSVSLSMGKSAAGWYSSKSYGVYFSTQDYNNEDKKGRKRPVVGYSNYNSQQSHFTKDFTRQSDGQITKTNPILPSSFYTSDAFNSSGQGIMGYFRGRRNDVGKVHDPRLHTNSYGVALNLELTKSFDVTPVFIQAPPIVPPPGIIVPKLSPTDSKWGAGGSISFGWDDQRPWNELNNLNFDFSEPSPEGIKENHFYKVHGEPTILEHNEYEHINRLDLALATFVPKNTNLFTGGKREINAGQNPHIKNERISALDDKRVVKNTLVHTFTNEEVHYLGEFNIRYQGLNSSLKYDALHALAGTTFPYMRDKKYMDGFDERPIKHHNAGFKVLNEEGSYYVYGLPAYNLLETENLFTVNAQNANQDIVNITTNNNEVDYKQNLTHKFINKTTKSPYAHSYLLTSVQGADYVDIGNNGPSDDDLGYWVKFNYVQYANNSKWRSPYHGANYSQGEKYTAEDDKGSYQYGTKEQWYVGGIETKSHIAIFEMEERLDMKEAAGEFANSAMGSKSGLKITAIKVYEKKAFIEAGVNVNNLAPLQTVHFEYDYSLCNSSPNSSAAGNGKLTLKKVWFESLKSTRGALSPYEFDYTSVDIPSQYASLANTGNNPENLVNPNYRRNAYDPWGGYHPWSNGYEQHSHFPYIAQTRDSWNQSWNSLYTGQEETVTNKALTQLANDMLASTWSLRKIKLPSGGEIKIDYESDDYSHVQHKVANQLFKVTGFGNINANSELYIPGLVSNLQNNPNSRRIYFKLEEPIPFGTPGIGNKVYKDYVQPIIKDESDTRNLYIKSKVILKDLATPVEEYISGYVALEDSPGFCGVSSQGAIIDGTNCYTEGYVTIQCTPRKNGGKFENYHPLSLLAWQYMQTNAQELLTPGSGLGTQGTIQNASDLFGMITNLLGAIPATLSAFGAIRLYCHNQGFASTVNLDETGIRLASPDRKKYGGGHRVKKITITDNWDISTGNSPIPEQSRTYGQIFDYTTTEDGRIMSSGVAQYEPQAGGDENPLKYPIHFFGKQNLFTANNLMAEAPVNEALFPGASVGYRKVTVKSLNTDTQMKGAIASNAVGRSGGVSVSEFYTAKDFPTMVSYSLLSESNNTKDVFNVPIPIPFIGSIKRNYYHGSQAFMIELNDMHGKPKAVRTFELNNYKIGNSPITESTYEYQTIPIVYQGEKVWKLDNRVRIVPKGENNPNLTDLADIPDAPAALNNIRLMGVESELFTDQRENKNFWNEAGLDFNVDIIAIFGIPSFWPSYSNHKTLFRTYVTNKVVHRSGILKKTKSRDLQTKNETEVLAYDEKAGSPLITRVKNEFGDDFYSYNIPAYYHYDRMGHAYQNINFSFSASAVTFDSYATNENGESGYTEIPASNEMKEHLVRGDELLVINDGNSNLHKKCYFLGWIRKSNGSVYAKIHFPTAINYSGDYTFKVIRSGRRNHYGTMSANYLTKGKLDPNVNSQAVGPTGEVVTVPVLDNVLSATASLFKDDWTTTASIKYDKDGSIGNPMLSPNPFLSGNSGIWRPFKSYTYVGSREGSASMNDNMSSDPQLKQDGIMNAVPMFTWDIGNMEEYVTNWEWVNEVSRFSSDAYELENVNRLGIHSSALYGYDNSLTIAVGGNASLHELGAYDFETAGPVTNYSRLLTQTNMNFNVTASTEVFMMENYNVSKAVMNSSNQITVETTIPFSYWTNHLSGKTDSHIALTLTSRQSGLPPNNEGYYFNGKINQNPTNVGGFASFVVTPYIEDENEQDNVLEINTKHHGKISFLITRGNNETITTNALVSTLKSHTGKKSLYVTGESTFEQPQLKTIAGKKYVVSLWISKESKKRTYKPGEAGNTVNELFVLGSRIGSGSFVANQGIINPKVTYGKVIEGWQKIDFEFEASESYLNLGFRFLQNGGLPIFIDDIRFSPKTGGITTYVYDPNKFWLRASLNVDNYATFFYYDEEGNLTIKKQETEQGIFTITESRGHVSE